MSSLAVEDHVFKRLWTFIKSQGKDYCNVPPIEFEGNTYSEHFDKAEALKIYFCSVFTTGSHDNYPSLEDVPFPSIPVLMGNLNVHKATGPDCIPARLLKELSMELARALTHIVQASLQQGRIPTECEKVNVVPIFKKGNHSLPSNYCPVSLTSICCKQLEHIISLLYFLTQMLIIYYVMNNMVSDRKGRVKLSYF